MQVVLTTGNSFELEATVGWGSSVVQRLTTVTAWGGDESNIGVAGN